MQHKATLIDYSVKASNIYYYASLAQIGGIETFFRELAKKYCSYDIVFIYKNADENQLHELRKYVRCVQYVSGMEIECDKAFFNNNLDIIDSVIAKEYILVIHGDYKAMNAKPPINDKITKVIGCSDVASRSYTELTGIPCETIYNPIKIDRPKRVVRIICACRIEDEVKGAGLTTKLIQAMDRYCKKQGTKYLMEVFSNNLPTGMRSKNVVHCIPRIDIRDYIADADFLIQTSKAEGYCYSAVEALALGTNVVCTPLPVFKELGILDKAIVLNHDASNIDEVVEKIFTKRNRATYIPPLDRWNEMLAESKSNYKGDEKMKVKALSTYEDMNIVDANEGRIIKEGEIFDVSKDRLDILLGNNPYHCAFVEVVEEKAVPKKKKVEKR